MVNNAYLCPDCFCVFLYKNQTIDHINQQHRDFKSRAPIEIISSKGKLKCPFCSVSFWDISYLGSHVSSNHAERKNHSNSIIEKQLQGSIKETFQEIDSDTSKVRVNNNKGIITELLVVDLVNISDIYLSKNQLREMLIKKNKVDPLNAIDKDVLIDVCKELYEEYTSMWYVTGEGSGLQICKASSVVEWQKMQAFSNIYIPSISVNGELIAFNEFTLYIYDSFNNLKCPESDKHKVENVTIITKNIYGKDVQFNAFHCVNCDKYYANSEAVKNQFILSNYPLFRINYVQIGDELRKESELTLYGYNAQKDGMPEFERQNLISGLLYYNVISKNTVIGILKNNINMHSNIPNHSEAVQKWKADLDFVMNLGLDSQKKVISSKTNIVYKGKIKNDIKPTNYLD